MVNNLSSPATDTPNRGDENMRRLTTTLGCAAVAIALIGCEDPSVGKPKASVSSAKPVAATSSAKPAAGNASWPITATDSKVEFAGSKVTGKHEGGFKKLTGEAKLVGGKIDGGSVSVEIDMDSVYSDAEQLTGHLKSPDFFDVAKHPKAKFVSTEIKAGGADGATHTVTGNLTLHGITKSISFPATIKVDGKALSVTSEFSINRKDFEIIYKGKPDDLIRDGVVIKLTLKSTQG